MEGKTVIAIAHRPPHRRDGPLIVLDEAGWWRSDHREPAGSRWAARLWAHQSGGFLAEPT
jgi:hypothetical protein